jgi:hypothetical protein
MQRLMEIATESAPRLTIRRAQEASALALHNELLLLDFDSMMGPLIYTWDTDSVDFMGPLTQATRLACGDLPLTDARLAVCREGA